MKKTLFFILLLFVVLLTGCNSKVNYSISFNSNGGTEVSSIKAEKNSTICMPEDPTKDGYIFDGWYFDNDIFENPFTSNSFLDTPLSSDVTVYAKWIGEADTNINHEETLQTGEFTYAFNSDGESYYLASYIGSDKNLIIPSMYNGYPVTSIGSQVFKDNKSIEYLVANDVLIIEYEAFSGADKLKYIEFKNAKTIESYAFSGATSLTSITIPNSVISIGEYAFSGASSLESMTIPFLGQSRTSSYLTDFGYIFGKSSFTGSYLANGYYIPNNLTEVVITDATSIGNSAFYGVRSLTSITISNSVTSIGNYAFSGSIGLTSIIIPNSVTTIGNYAFYGSMSLTIYIEAHSTPSGWYPNWNPDDRPVVWGYIED